MSDLKRTGGCLCGAVEFELTLKETDVHVCYCGLCQRHGGGPSLSLGCEKDWNIKGEDNITWYDSSDFAQRSFCSKCGTHLFFRMKDGSYHGIGAATLDSQDGFKIGMHIFVDKKPDYYDFADESPRLTEEEFLKMVGAA